MADKFLKKMIFIFVFISSFIVAGIADNFTNKRTFQTFSSEQFHSLPISAYFIFYEAAFIAAGFVIIYSMRKKSIDLLTLPAWLVGFDAVSLIFNNKQVIGQENWRAQIWGSAAGVIGENLFGIPLGYWISFAFLAIYLVLAYKPEIFKKFKL